MDSPKYDLVIRTPAAQARADRRRRTRRLIYIGALTFALLTPSGRIAEDVAPAWCSHTWVC